MACTDFIIQTVIKVMKRHHTRDPFQICEKMGIFVRYKDLGASLKAYYFVHSRIHNIILNQDVEPAFGKVLCAHELGHALLHTPQAGALMFRELNVFDVTGHMEYEANLFAAELLIRDEDILRLGDESPLTIQGLAAELFVPVELIDFKLRILKHKGYTVNTPYDAKADFLQVPT